MKNVTLIFPNQLFKNIEWIDRSSTIFLIEEYLFFRQYDFHKQKLAFHRASMKYYFDYFITKIGAAPFRGSGGSVKKGANNLGNDGMAYRVHGCGIRGVGNADPIVIGLESVVVLPK